MFDTMFPLLLVRFCAAAICSFALSVPLSGAEPGGDVGGRSVKITLRSADGTRAQGRLLSCDANGCEIMTDKGQVQGARWADLDLESAVRALRQILADEPTARWSQVVDAFAAQHNLAKLAERMATQVRIREPAAPGARPKPLARAAVPAGSAAPAEVAWSLPPGGPAKGFIRDLCQDAAGDLWVATEGDAIWRIRRHDGRLASWEPARQGLIGNEWVRLACDGDGRMWAGGQSQGLAFHDGRQWTTPPVAEGTGRHVTAMAASPLDGDVWVASESGLARYRRAMGAWQRFTCRDGLPSTAISCLAFDRAGKIYVGTQCEGIATAYPAEEYRTWRAITGPVLPPPVPTGSGLPSNRINDVLVAHDGRVYAATACGLATSNDRGHTWTYRRGAEWRDRARGAYDRSVQAAEAQPDRELREDQVTTCVEDAQGFIWLGHAQGYSILRADGTVCFGSGAKGSEVPERAFIRVLACIPEGMVLGTYGNGCISAHRVGTARPAGSGADPLAGLAPAAAARPATDWRQWVARRLEAAPRAAKPSSACVALDDDCSTRGDWLGRYGSLYACLFAQDSPRNLYWGALHRHYALAGGVRHGVVSEWLGPCPSPLDAPRYWVHWLYTDDQRSLELPPDYAATRRFFGRGGSTPRRQSEIDDHGETYPMDLEGPDIFLGLSIPAGEHEMSLYFFNKDGHASMNRFRDYEIEIKEQWFESDVMGQLSDAQVAAYAKSPLLARARVQDFWGGIWKRFAIRGGRYTLRIKRAHSFNTICSGVFLDALHPRGGPDASLPDSLEADHAARQKLRAGGAALPVVSGAYQVDLALLDRWRLVDPFGWARDGRLIHHLLALELAAKPMRTRDEDLILATCWRHARQHGAAEAVLARLGVGTPRDEERQAGQRMLALMRWVGRHGLVDRTP